MTIYDISVPIAPGETPTYPGDPGIEVGSWAAISRGVRLVGIDYLSVEEFGSKHFETHRVLLSNRVVILEGLDLRAVAPGRYELICLPLKIAAGSGDGAPARAVLRTLD